MGIGDGLGRGVGSGGGCLGWVFRMYNGMDGDGFVFVGCHRQTHLPVCTGIQ